MTSSVSALHNIDDLSPGNEIYLLLLYSFCLLSVQPPHRHSNSSSPTLDMNTTCLAVIIIDRLAQTVVPKRAVGYL